LNQRIRREIRNRNRSWRVDETYVKVGGNRAYLYRAVDSAGEPIRRRRMSPGSNEDGHLTAMAQS
jgi:transposase-like protein